MKIEGIDRVVVSVKDLDKAMEFFSSLLNVKFDELTDPASEEAGVRLSSGTIPQNCTLRIELIQAVPPVKDVRPPDTKALEKAVEGVDASCHALIFRVKDTGTTSDEVKDRGIRIYAEMEIPEVPPWKATDFKEFFTEPDDTLGLPLAFVEYKEEKK